ncbi:MAG: Leu/Phe/Val dehydrogenase [Sulfobacillus sp.]
MDIFAEMERHGHEQVVFCYDKQSGLKMVVGIHSTALGPALGGCRMWTYAKDDDAVQDVLRLSEGMTYKNAAMGLDLGGGKTVVIAAPDADREALFEAVGRFIESLGGRYVTAEDVGTTTEDMAVVARQTTHVRGLKGASGDPSSATSVGVFVSIEAALKEAYGSGEIAGRTFAVQGLGHVGRYLVDQLTAEGGHVVVTDIDPAKVSSALTNPNVSAVEPDQIYDVVGAAFVPCALGAILNDQTIPRLRVKVVAGSANNQLAEPRHGAMLAERGILYAPDFIVNGGGVINVADEMNPGGYNKERAALRVLGIRQRLKEIFRISREGHMLPVEAANHLAEERIRREGHAGIYLAHPAKTN